jgi:hypothetical protein
MAFGSVHTFPTSQIDERKTCVLYIKKKKNSIADLGKKMKKKKIGKSIKIIVANFLQQVAAKSLRFATEGCFQPFQ